VLEPGPDDAPGEAAPSESSGCACASGENSRAISSDFLICLSPCGGLARGGSAGAASVMSSGGDDIGDVPASNIVRSGTGAADGEPSRLIVVRFARERRVLGCVEDRGVARFRQLGVASSAFARDRRELARAVRRVARDLRGQADRAEVQAVRRLQVRPHERRHAGTGGRASRSEALCQ
jgi:hypothetical protein